MRLVNWRYLLIGLLAYLVFLVVQFPAERAYAWWKSGPGAQQPLLLAGIEGSVWAGHAERAKLGAQSVDGLRWRLHPWQVFSGAVGLDVDLRLRDGFARGELKAGVDGRFEIEHLEARLPLAALAVPALQALRPEGVLHADLREVAWNGHSLASAEGRLVWSGAAVQLLQPLPLGDLSLTLHSDPEGVSAALADAGGPLLAEGLLTLGADGAYQFSGRLGARNDAPPALQQALRGLGRAGADGRIAIERSGRLANLLSLPR